MIELAGDAVTEVCTSFGERGLRAEAVAERCLQQARKYLAGGAPVGEHLADQLLVPLAMAGGGSYVTTALTEHARTNIEIVRTFLDVNVTVTRDVADRWRVAVDAAHRDST
jgi:RNA 3'-terminal phosphate cyclase (ATP)